MQVNKSQLGWTVVVILLTAIPSAFAAQPPDLSGRWTLDMDASTLSPQLKPFYTAGEIANITQTADAITIETTGRNGKPITMAIKSDGTETTSEFPNATVKVRGKWEGDKLVVHTSAPARDGKTTETTASWFLRDAALVWQDGKGNAAIYKKSK